MGKRALPQPRTRPPRHVIATANLRKRFLPVVAALDRLFLLVRREFRLTPHFDTPWRGRSVGLRPCGRGVFTQAGPRPCENSAEVTPLKKIPAFSRPQVDQKEENRKRGGCERPFSTEIKLGAAFSHRLDPKRPSPMLSSIPLIGVRGKRIMHREFTQLCDYPFHGTPSCRESHSKSEAANRLSLLLGVSQGARRTKMATHPFDKSISRFRSSYADFTVFKLVDRI